MYIYNQMESVMSDTYHNARSPQCANKSTPLFTKTADQVQPESIYVSYLLKILKPKIYKCLLQTCKAHRIPLKTLKGTKDIWARDYMPLVSADGKSLRQFIYEPSYLEDFEELCTCFDAITNFKCRSIGRINFKLEGGNVIHCDNRAITTDRIYSENAGIERELIESEIKSALSVDELIVLPSLPPEVDMTGHIDGMVRFIDRDRVLLSMNPKDHEIKERIKTILRHYQLSVIELPISKSFYTDTCDWAAYINFLRFKNVLFVPIHGVTEDVGIISFFKELFLDCIVEAIDVSEIIRVIGDESGGALHCITWEY